MDEKKMSWILICIFLGIISGTVCANLMQRTQPELLYAFAVDPYITAMQTSERKGFAQYLLQQRGLQGIGVLLICLFCNSLFLAVLFALSGGFVWGMILSIETMRLGIQGLFMGIACFLPHGVCYAAAVWLFLFGKEEIRQNTDTSVRSRMLWIMLPIVLTMSGILLEIWISPKWLQWILN